MGKLARALRRRLPSVYVAGKAVRAARTPGSYVVTTGYVQSLIEDRPCRPDGSPMPWMNYSMVEFLDERLRPDMALFEYGSGNSTAYFARRVGVVHAVEHRPEWHRIVVDMLRGTEVEVALVADDVGSYIDAIRAHDRTYDVVVVDGRRRAACCQRAIDVLSPGGVIILDDSERHSFSAAFESMPTRGFRHLTFTGLKPTGVEPSSTTIFYRPDNVLGI